MINPIGLKERPLCEMCKQHPGLVFYQNKLICGRCAVKMDELNQKFKEKFNKLKDKFILQELNKQEENDKIVP